MISEEALAQAVTAEIITAAQAESLRTLQAAMPPPPAMDAWAAPVATSPDEESLRFISGFSDIFVALGIFLFFGAAAFFLQHFFGRLVMWAGGAAIAWLLAEFFTRARRMALPSIILLLLFVFSVFAATTEAVVGWSPFSHGFALVPWQFLWGASITAIWVAGLVTTACAALHYWRFRVPITVAAAALALSTTFIMLVVSLWPRLDRLFFQGLILLCGIVVFAVAMRFDSSDPERVTRRTDIAFWLHLLAAPLIVHPIIQLFWRQPPEPSAAVACLGVFFLFALVAVAIDRRAMLVSGLTYAGVALTRLLNETLLSGFSVPATLLALGAFVLLLSAGWQPLRRTLLQFFPAPILRRLPRPVRGAS